MRCNAVIRYYPNPVALFTRGIAASHCQQMVVNLPLCNSVALTVAIVVTARLLPPITRLPYTHLCFSSPIPSLCLLVQCVRAVVAPLLNHLAAITRPFLRSAANAMIYSALSIVSAAIASFITITITTTITTNYQH